MPMFAPSFAHCFHNRAGTPQLNSLFKGIHHQQRQASGCCLIRSRCTLYKLAYASTSALQRYLEISIKTNFSFRYIYEI